MIERETVYIVDDDDDVRKSVEWLVTSVGLKASTFASSREFLKAYDADKPGCVVLDLRMPGVSGTKVHEALLDLAYCPPIVFLTAHGDVPTAVQALRNGAVDFLQKPVNDQVLLDTIQAAISRDLEARGKFTEQQTREQAIARLTAREREVMDLLLEGKSQKQIASSLGIGVQTASKLRAKVLSKINVRNEVELVRLLCDCSASVAVTN